MSCPAPGNPSLRASLLIPLGSHCKRGRRKSGEGIPDGLRAQPPCDTLPPVPSFPELFVLLSGGLLLPGLPVALGAIRSSSSSISSSLIAIWSFIASLFVWFLLVFSFDFSLLPPCVKSANHFINRSDAGEFFIS